MQMALGVGLQGSNVVMLFGADVPPRLVARPFGAANDNGSRETAKTVTVRRQLEKSGVAIKIKVPVEEFVGVAVATRSSEEGVLTSTIELIHGDPELNYQVFEEVGNGDVVAEWQNWGKTLRLPLFIRAGDGSLLPYSQQVDGVAVGNDSYRRKFAPDAARRARFLNRRKPGGAE